MNTSPIAATAAAFAGLVLLLCACSGQDNGGPANSGSGSGGSGNSVNDGPATSGAVSDVRDAESPRDALPINAPPDAAPPDAAPPDAAPPDAAPPDAAPPDAAPPDAAPPDAPPTNAPPDAAPANPTTDGALIAMDSASSEESAPSGDDDSGGGSVMSGAAHNYGTVTVSEGMFQGAPETSVSASFVPNFVPIADDASVLAAFADAGIVFKTVGDCLVASIESMDADSEAGSQSGADAGFGTVSAGTLTVTGGSGPITLSPSSNLPGYTGYSYASLYPPNGPTIVGGAALSIMATGATAPAFTVGITMPGDIVVTQPRPPAIDSGLPFFGKLSAPIVRSGDLAVAWTGGASGNVVVNLGQVTAATTSSVVCTFQESAGGGTIPAAALSNFAPGDAFFGIAPTATKTVSVADWNIKVTAASAGGFSASATVQ
jgi:hypothetical protein